MGPLPSGGLSRVLDTTIPPAARSNATQRVSSATAPDIKLFNELLLELAQFFRPAVSTPTRSIQVPSLRAVKIIDPNPNRVGLAIANMPASTGNLYWSDSPGVQGALPISTGQSAGGVYGMVLAPGATFTWGPECRSMVLYLIADVASTEVRVAEEIAIPIAIG